MKMDPKELDEYMDYYERTFIDPERAEQKSRGLPKQLLDMFPTSRFDGSEPTPYSHQDQAEKEQVAAEQTLKTVVGSLKLRPVTSADGDGDEGGYRIGSYYKRYRRVEDLNELARVFYERVALAVGVSLETLVVAVSQVERTLIRFRGKKSKDQGEAEQGCDEEHRDDRGGDEVGEDVEMGNVTEGRDEDFYSD